MPPNGRKEHWVTCLWAGCTYALMVYAIGFVLGAIRVLLLVPRLGAFVSVLLELPLILGASFLFAKVTVKRFAVPEQIASRALMGATAFSVLMCGELAVFVFVFGNPSSAFLTQFATAPGAMGLAGQVAFALFPSLQRRPGKI